MIKVNIDASFHPDYSLAGLGLVMVVDHEQTVYQKYLCNIFDNHLAEFNALFWALKLLKDKNLQDNIISLESDSQIVTDSVSKEYVARSEYKGILAEILNELNSFPLTFIKWVPESNNKGADQAARQALQKGLKELNKKSKA